jgi:hypothetical protein
MKRIKTMGLCLVAALALGAMTASLAQAESPPEFFTKAPVGGTAPSEVKETNTLGISFLEGKTSKAKIECEKGSGEAVVSGPKSTKEALTLFKVCEIKALSLPCENKGAGTKEIETKNLVGELGLIATTKDGIRLKPETGTYLAEFECGGGAIQIKVKGSLIGEITGSAKAGETIAQAKFGSSGGIAFSESAGVQKYTKFLGESTGHQLENVVTEGGKTHEELGGQSGKVTVKSVPASDIGETV